MGCWNFKQRTCDVHYSIYIYFLLFQQYNPEIQGRCSTLSTPLSLNACKLFLCQIMFSPFPQSLFCTTSRQFCFHAILLAPGHLIDQFSQTEQTNRVYWMPEGYYNTKIFRHDGNVARLNVCRQEWRKQKQSGPIRVCLCSGEICDEIRASSYIACLISGPQSLQSGCTPYQPN